MRRKLYLLALMLIGVTLILPEGNAFAASAYDDNYHTTSTLTVGATAYNADCSDVDMTNTWPSYILNSSQWRSGADWSSARASLLAALTDTSDGQWGASQFTEVGDANHGNGYSKYVVAFWSQDSSAHFDWTTNGWDGGSFPYNAVMYSGSSVNVAVIRCSNNYYGDGLKKPVVIGAYLNQTSAGDISTKTNQACGFQGGVAVIWCSVSNLSAHNIDTNQPSGYAGATIDTSSNLLAPIQGGVQCFVGNDQVTKIHIIPASGAEGDAVITGDSSSGYSYTFYPSESSSTYNLEITCGGTVMPAGPAYTATTNDTWYCSTAASSECYLQ